jgi:hypothetical protein
MRLSGSLMSPGCPVQGARQGCRSLRFPLFGLQPERGAGYLPGSGRAGPGRRAGEGKRVKTLTDGVEPVTDGLPPHRVPVRLSSHALSMHRAVRLHG